MGEHKRSYELYGAISLVVAAVLVLLSILMFKQTFTDKVPVTMHISRAGLQLLPGSDVKLRGLIVGDVKRIDTKGSVDDPNTAIGAGNMAVLKLATTFKLPAVRAVQWGVLAWFI